MANRWIGRTRAARSLQHSTAEVIDTYCEPGLRVNVYKRLLSRVDKLLVISIHHSFDKVTTRTFFLFS